MSESIAEWWSGGERVPLELGGVELQVFVRRLGDGASMTLLHGFPSSSHDWAKVAPALAERHALLMPDFLGFGASEKPAEHDYSLREQAELVDVRLEQVGPAEEHLRALDRRALSPVLEGAGGGAHGAVDILDAGLRDGAEQRSGGGVDRVERAAGCRGHASAVDHQFLGHAPPPFM